MTGSGQPRHRHLAAELFIGSQWYVCGVVTISAKGLLVDAPVNTATPIFARLHLHGAEEHVLDLDVMVRRRGPSPRQGSHRLLVAYVEAPEHLQGTLERLARGFERAQGTAVPTGVLPRRGQQANRLTPGPRGRRATPRSCDEKRAAVTSKQSISEVDTSPEAMLEIYREAIGENGRGVSNRAATDEKQEPRSLWSKLKKVATTKL